ncbi:hypothetical protein HD806DRAFT_523045 [Xylariaceae sp. AK1471]|nr:hypothetical protein HD806DRAFT_523045 [Xylariaceae sp. AK1471]
MPVDREILSSIKSETRSQERSASTPGSRSTSIIRSASRNRTHDHRAGAIAVRDKNKNIRVPCHNCGLIDHKEADCNSPCVICGRHSHSISDCPKRSEGCVCAKRPFHLLRNCKRICEYCPRVHPDSQKHQVKDCTMICHYCLVAGHKTSDCEKQTGRERACPSCATHGEPESYHLRSQCIWRWCPAPGCMLPFNCTDHCLECGYDMIDEAFLNGQGGHKCLFTKVWTSQPGPSGLPDIVLQCKENFEHKFTVAELEDTRKRAYASMLDHLVKKDSAVLRSQECPKCLKADKDLEMHDGARERVKEEEEEEDGVTDESGPSDDRPLFESVIE